MEINDEKSQARRLLPLKSGLLTLLCSAGLFTSAVQAAEPIIEDPQPLAPEWAENGTLNLYFENDLFAETDQNYTNGIRASYVTGDLTSFLDDPELPEWIRTYNSLINPLLNWHNPNINPQDTHRNLVVTFGQQIYTPSDINRTTVDPDDRPYAGWLYLGVGYNQNNDRWMDSTQLNIGIVGPAALGQEAQDFIHDLRGFEKFEGWDNQLHNELGVQFVYETKYRQSEYKLVDDINYDIIYHSGFSLGNVATYLNAGAELRIGWNLPNDFGTSTLRPGGDNSAPGRYKLGTTTSVHAFLSADARLVARDIFLDGNTFSNSHSIDKEYLVGDLAAGVAMLNGRWKFAYAQIFRTKEFKGQPHSHSYGSFSVTYNF
ncbi:lipid A deacylase LpxR family protein [Aliamphritea ceti]|uniref:lipid A deacylase LpxR family protein n=1 Tax=Aliamphritea ceti TaxID=1524258 RepID=UPI0021C43772|nr:lipid A deacylase LpxR family protein [Aliamphritea ceti]